jgi:SAM-dependent methyltransferase
MLTERMVRWAGTNPHQQWARVVMDRETKNLIGRLNVRDLSALEISGTKWRDAGFGTYEAVQYPEYDVCERPYRHEGFDIVVAEQVLEHVLWPYRAVRHIHQSLRPNGYFMVTTPFLIRIHRHPTDCSRWSETGLKHLLAEGGFALDRIVTGSWGNRGCVVSNFRKWTPFNRYFHSLRNEPDYPVVVWALAQKD